MSVPSEEQWRPVPGYEGTYEVSDQGRLYGHPRRNTKGGLTRQRVAPSGYLIVDLSQKNQRSTHYVHRLVALAFLGPCPPGLEVRHLDDDPTNAVLTNLAYGTSSQNKQDMLRRGTHNNAAKTHCPQGHPYDEANTYRSPVRSNRHCRKCHVAKKKRQRRARSLARRSGSEPGRAA